MKRLFVAISLLGLLQLSVAQDNEKGIEEVTIHGKFLNIPYQQVNENIIVISKNELKNAPAQSIDEVLQQFVGLDITRRGANGVQSDISVRGGSFEQVLILINGVRMNDAQTGHNSLNIPVDMANVERIEVVKGPSARRFGNAAYAAINIVTKTNSTESLKISAEGGDYATYNLGLSGTFGTGKFSNLLQINTGASEGYRHNTDYQIRNAFYQNQLKIQNGKLQFQAGFSEKKFGANGFYATPLATEQYEETQASVVSAAYEQTFGKVSLNSKIYWRRGQDMYLYNRQRPEIYRNMHIGNNIGGEVNMSYQSEIGTTNLGIELRKDILVSNRLGHRNRFNTQLFFEHHFAFFNDKLTISPGASWTNISNSGNFFYPGLDVGFDFNKNHKIYGNIAKLHRIPSFTDLYYVSRTEIGNADLKPENAVSYEVGYRFLKNNLSAKLGVFAKETENGIDWVKNTESELWKAQNIGNINMKGLEVEWQHTNIGDFIKSYFVGYSYLESKQKQISNFSKYVQEHLKHQFIAKVENQLFGNFINQLIYRYNQRWTGQSYNLLDAKLSYRKNDLDIYALVNNITNTNYTEAFGVPMPRRWFHIGVSYTIK